MITSFSEFKNNIIKEEETVLDKIQKNEELENKLKELKLQYEQAVDKGEEKKAHILKLKLELCECDIRKFQLEKKLDQLQGK